ncbi:hypothetical protein [Runella sp.]|uniref:hypothetical protein n=1 Tax=Runella sp. TaxID=1960881 RepID=UPI003D101D9C
MKSLNSEIRSSRILYFWVCYAGVVALLGISIYLNLRKIPELALERNQSTETEIKNFLVETGRLDDYIRGLTKSQNLSAGQLQTIFGFITQLQLHYNKPLFSAVLKSYEAFVKDLGNARTIQDDEWKQLTAKYSQLVQEKQQLDLQLQQLQQQRAQQ